MLITLKEKKNELSKIKENALPPPEKDFDIASTQVENPKVYVVKEKKWLKWIVSIAIVCGSGMIMYYNIPGSEERLIQLKTFVSGGDSNVNGAIEPKQNKTEIITHEYDYIISDETWEEANQACLNKGGYLAHIETEEEWNRIISEITARGYEYKKFYIGGKRSSNSNDYYWVDKKGLPIGEKINSSAYVNFWMEGEPSYSDRGISEKYMMMYYFDNGGRWVFNDVSNDVATDASIYKGKLGYICEFERKSYE